MLLSSEALRSLFWCDPRYDIAALLVPGGLTGRRVEFRRCDGCGGDGRLYINSVFAINCHSHGPWRQVLPNLEQALDPAAFRAVRLAVHKATWMHGYEPVPGMLVLASRADVARYGRGRDDVVEEMRGLLDEALRFGGDNR